MSDAGPLYHLDWLTLSGRGWTDADGVEWILTEETGFWDSPKPRKETVDRTNAHGAYVGPMYYEQRIITMEGRAYAPTPRLMRSAQARVTALCSDRTAEYPMSCDSEIGTLTCSVRLDDAVTTKPVQVLTDAAFEFSAQFIAPDPRKYAQESRTMTARVPHGDAAQGLDFLDHDGMQVPPSGHRGLRFRPQGLSFGGVNATGVLTLTNRGTAPTCPVYILHGPLTTPTLTAAADGRVSVMRYNATIPRGEHVVIDPAAPSVLLNGSEQRRWLLNPAHFSGFFIPQAGTGPGKLTVSLSHDGLPTSAGYVSATFRDAWF